MLLKKLKQKKKVNLFINHLLFQIQKVYIYVIKINMNVWVDIEIYLNNLKDKEIMKVI